MKIDKLKDGENYWFDNSISTRTKKWYLGKKDDYAKPKDLEFVYVFNSNKQL